MPRKKCMKQQYLKDLIEAGTDEAGRGCLAGPVVAAAVILPDHFDHPLLNDSKKLTERQRQLLRPVIEAGALDFGVAFINENVIDEINILQASMLAMHHSLDKLKLVPEHIIVDGNKFKNYKNIPHKTIVKGDSKFKSIAAASVLAKTYRDDFMKKIALEYPDYKWEKNKGYPTAAHREAIAAKGAVKYHRKSFRLLPEQLKLDLD